MIRFRQTAALAVVFAVAAGGCGKKEEPGAQEPSTPAAISTPPESGKGGAATPVPPAPPADLGKLAAMTGYAAELPSDFQTFLQVDIPAFRRGLAETSVGKAFEEMLPPQLREDAPESRPGGSAAEELGEDEPVPTEGQATMSSAMDPGMVFLRQLINGRVFLATGATTADQTGNLMRLLQIINEGSLRQSLRQAALGLGVLDPATLPEGWDTEPKSMFGDVDGLMNVAKPMAPPVLMLGLEVTGDKAAAMEMLAEWDSEMSKDLPPFVTRKEVEQDSGTFVTFSIKGGNLIPEKEFNQAMEDLGRGDLDPATLKAHYEMLAAKTVTFGYGMRKGYVLLFAGENVEALTFAASPEASMLKRPEFAHLAGFGDIDPFLLTTSEGSVLTRMRTMQDPGYIFDVFSEVLGECTGLGDVRDIVALSKEAAEKLRILSQAEDMDFAAAAWFEEGVRIEAVGGTSSPDIDVSEPLRMAGKLADEDTVLMLVGRSDEEYARKALDWLEDVAEISYELTRRVAASEDAPKELGEMFPLFDEKMLPHVVEIWGALSGDTGLGAEGALVMDLAAPLPKLPGVPEALVKKGRIPRIAMVYDLEDRKKLDAAWGRIEPAVKGLIESLPMPEKEKPKLPDPFTSEKDGFKTWFYGISGFTSDDFMPSVTLGDDLFFMSSSKNLSEMVGSRLAGATADAKAPHGLVMELRFGPLREVGALWLDLLRENKEEVFPSESAATDFLETESNIRMVLEGMRHVDAVSLHRWKEGVDWRTSLRIRMPAK